MKKAISLFLAMVLMLACATAFASDTAKTPKYVFMFIGDGMGSPQVTATQYYLGAVENPDAAVPTPAQLSFTEWKNVGLMTTYDATSFNPDSASTASAMASGIKTLSGVINYAFAKAADGTLELTEPSKLITEYAKESGMKVGVISSVSLNHATPRRVLCQKAEPQRVL